MKGRFDPGSGLVLQPGIVTMMMIWFVLCLTGLLGPVANTAHGVGLLVGVLMGLVEAKMFRRQIH
jgi:GlpG protein